MGEAPGAREGPEAATMPGPVARRQSACPGASATTAVMGRKTYDVLMEQGGQSAMPPVDVIIFSRPVRRWSIRAFAS